MSKDILTRNPQTTTAPLLNLTRTGTLRAEGSLGSEDEMTRPSKDLGPDRRTDLKTDNADNIFMDDVSRRPVLRPSRSLIPFCRSPPLFNLTLERLMSELGSKSTLLGS